MVAGYWLHLGAGVGADVLDSEIVNKAFQYLILLYNVKYYVICSRPHHLELSWELEQAKPRD